MNWLESFPKTINDNGCWIPDRSTNDLGYVAIMIDGERYYLHRLAMCIKYGISYTNYKLETRHSKGCSRKCFNPEHLNYGSRRENALDAIEHGTNYNLAKKNCPKCGCPYRTIIRKSGDKAGTIERYCGYCSTIKQRERWRRLDK